jgi:hypothetical protein
MDAATLTLIVTLANGEVTTTTRGFASMKGCEALAAAFLATENGTGRTVVTKCEKVAPPADQPEHQ